MKQGTNDASCLVLTLNVNLNTINLGDVVQQTAQAWEGTEQKTLINHGEKLHTEEKQFEDTVTHKTAEENCENLSRLLKLT